MQGEILSLIVAVMWTFTALFAEIASRRMGALTLNVWRMILSIIILGCVLFYFTGTPLPQYTDGKVWFWMLASGFMGFVFGDYCLFNSYLVMGSRFGQLFMTLASPFAALAGWVLLGESMKPIALLGMVVTISGIAMSILGKTDDGQRGLKLPLKGVLLGIGAAMGQGVGLVLSKLGLQAYEMSVPFGVEVDPLVLPFGGTMIRTIMGLLGVGVALLWTRQQNTMPRLWQDKTTTGAALGTILLGPVFGVSFSLYAVTLTSAGIAQTLMALTPVFILWPAHLIFGTKITVIEVLGAIVAVCGASLFFLPGM